MYRPLSTVLEAPARKPDQNPDFYGLTPHSPEAI